MTLRDLRIIMEEIFMINKIFLLRVILSIDIWHPSLSNEDITVLSHPVFKDFGYAVIR